MRNVDHNKTLKAQKLYGNRLTGLNSQAENEILKLHIKCDSELIHISSSHFTANMFCLN
jgi:hypothetical protein